MVAAAVAAVACVALCCVSGLKGWAMWLAARAAREGRVVANLEASLARVGELEARVKAMETQRAFTGR